MTRPADSQSDLLLAVSLGSSIAILDQVTKCLVMQRFIRGESVTVIPHLFSLTYIRNYGAAWGIFSGQGQWLAVLSILMLGVIILFRKSFMKGLLWHRIATGLLIGGIIGNLVDRIKLGYVVDFLDFYLGARHFPAFNVADSAICVGVALYMIAEFMLARQARDKDSRCEESRHTS